MKPPQGSRTAAVVDALLDLLRAADPEHPDDLDAVQIVDGPPIEGRHENDVLNVAPGDPGEAGVLVTRTQQPSLGRHTYLEQTEVTMLISVFSGDTNMKTRRDRATEIFDAVKRRVDANRVHTTAWENLFLGPQEIWHQVQSEEGSLVFVGFTVIAEAIV